MDYYVIHSPVRNPIHRKLQTVYNQLLSPWPHEFILISMGYGIIMGFTEYLAWEYRRLPGKLSRKFSHFLIAQIQKHINTHIETRSCLKRNILSIPSVYKIEGTGHGSEVREEYPEDARLEPRSEKNIKEQDRVVLGRQNTKTLTN